VLAIVCIYVDPYRVQVHGSPIRPGGSSLYRILIVFSDRVLLAIWPLRAVTTDGGYTGAETRLALYRIL
jgi:hypothetical protein